MSISDLGAFPHTVGNLEDQPNLSAAEMKERFERDCVTLWDKVKEDVIPEVNKKADHVELSNATIPQIIEMRANSFMTLYDSGYTWVQGMCVINDQYLVIARGKESGVSFQVYDVINKSYVTESVLSSSDVGHCNSLSYDDGYIYVATGIYQKGIVRLAFDDQTKAITYDSVVAGPTYANVGVHDGVAYMTSDGLNGVRTICKTEDWNTFSEVFTTTFDGMGDVLASQGLEYDGTYLYFCLSGEQHGQTMVLETEYIYIIDPTTGKTVRSLSYARGVASEIEDISIVSVSNQKYAFIATNKNDAGVALVHVVPLSNYTMPVKQFTTPDIKNVLSSQETEMTVFVSAQNGTVFADGSETNPFKHPAPALTYIKRMNVPATLVLLDGTFGDLLIRYMSNLTIRFNGGTINRITFNNCSGIMFDKTVATGTTVKELYVYDSMIISRSGPEFVGTGTSYAIWLYRSIYCGSFGTASDYSYLVAANSSMANLRGTVTDVTNIADCVGSMVCVNSTLYGVTIS